MRKRNRFKTNKPVRAKMSGQTGSRSKDSAHDEGSHGGRRKNVAGFATMGRRLRRANSGQDPFRHDGERKRSPRKKQGSHQYDDWTKEQLYEQAKKDDIEGRSRMSRDELVKALSRD